MIRVTLRAEGAPAEVVRLVSDQAKAARRLHPEWGPVVSAARDTLVTAAQQHPADTVVTLSATVECHVAVLPVVVSAPVEPVPAEIPQDAKQVVGHTEGFARTRKVN